MASRLGRGHFIDLTGQRVGYLLVLRRVANVGTATAWRCRCDCGNLVTVLGYSLNSKNTSSCGCFGKRARIERNTAKRIAPGELFGRLTVLKFHSMARGRDADYLCRCACGAEKVVRGYRLRSGHTVSCGCYSTELKRLKQPGDAERNRVFRTYVANAKKRGLAFTLTRDESYDLFASSCFYCGAPPSNTSRSTGTWGSFTYSGIDRVDSTEGYIQGNVRPCCKACNIAKHNYSVDAFLAWAHRLAEHQGFASGGVELARAASG